jgi:hypothetical protein
MVACRTPMAETKNYGHEYEHKQRKQERPELGR